MSGYKDTESFSKRVLWVEPKLVRFLIREGGSVVMTFEASTDHDVPIPEGAVRMTRMQGAYGLSPDRNNPTEVVFEVQADPGGWIPDWMARWAAKAIPTDTLKGLHNRIARDNEIAGK